MALKQTVIIPIATSSIDEQTIKDIKTKANTLMLIVLGNDENAQKAAECADLRAEVEVAGFQRQSIWVQDKKFFQNSLYNYLELSPGNSGFSISDIDTIVAISISPEREIRNILKNTDTINYATIELAYLQAGQ